MKALLFEQFGGDLRVESVADPTVSPRGVVVAVKRTGVCRSDWHGWQGHDADISLPHVPGHELAGEVVEIGREVTTLRVGDRVTVPFVSGCGSCTPCQEGEPQVCDAQFQPGFTHWGSFAEYVALEYADDNVVVLPPQLGYAEAAALGCRFTTAYRAVVQLGELRADQSVAVFGMGGVGLSVLMIARCLGAQVVAVDVDPAKLELAATLGAQHCIDATSGSVAREISELTRGGVHLSVDALGSERTVAESIACLRKRGKHLQVGLLIGERVLPRVDLGRVISHELTLFGSHGISSRAYQDVFALIERHGLRLEELVGATVGLSGAAAALRELGGFGGRGITLVDPALGDLEGAAEEGLR